MNTHWTESSIENFRYRITSDFLEQLIKKMKAERMSQKDLAQKLKISAGRVSQIINGEMNNFSLEKIIGYARALEMKVSLVAYEDGDPGNTHGPVDSEIFTVCWERQGKPLDFFDLEGNKSVSRKVWNAATRAYIHYEKDRNLLGTDAFNKDLQITSPATIKLVANGRK